MASPTTSIEPYEKSIPRIAVIGRPNVGKSTLFNRLIRKRKSITDPTPGVTRDPVYAYTDIAGRRALLIDTGGLTESREFLDKLITGRSMDASKSSDVLLFVVDVEEITAEDEEFMKRLRMFSSKIILVVNKVDNLSRSFDAYEFYSFGFSSVCTISAAHGIGIEDLITLIADKLGTGTEAGAGTAGVIEPVTAISDEDEARDDASDAGKTEGRFHDVPWDISIALLGQPNTGKSTLSNLFLGREQSIVSSVAGTTRDVIEGLFEYGGKVFRVLDTAGIRRKRKVEEDIEYYSVNRAIKTIEDADIVVLLIDVEKGLVEQDKKIAAQIVKRGRGVIIAANKWDTLEQTPNTVHAVTDRIRFLFPVLEFAPVLPLCALNGDGAEAMLKTALHLHEELNTRIETARLNTALATWIEKTPPPQNAKHRWKLRYLTQVSKHPVRFVLFVNKTKGFPDSYVGYIKNRIRKEFGFTSIPIHIELRERR